MKNEDIGNNLFQIHLLNLHFKFAREPEQLPGDRSAALDGLQNVIDVADQFLIPAVLLLENKQIFHIPGGFVDQSQGVIDLMGDAGSQSADRLELLRLTQSLFGQMRHIPQCRIRLGDVIEGTSLHGLHS